MRIGVVGAGSIGCYVGGKLLAANADVLFVGRPRVRDELASHGLAIKDFANDPVVIPSIAAWSSSSTPPKPTARRR